MESTPTEAAVATGLERHRPGWFPTEREHTYDGLRLELKKGQQILEGSKVTSDDDLAKAEHRRAINAFRE